MSSTQGKKRRREDGGGAKTHKGKDGKAGGGAAGTKPGLKHKKRKKERQVKKKGGELLIETKRLWEAIRRKDITKKERSAQVTALLKICRGQMLEIICKHDGSRVIQALVKFGDADERAEVMTELSGLLAPPWLTVIDVGLVVTGKMLALAKSPYAKHLVVTMLRYGSSEVKEKILKEFHGRVRKLVRHRDAAPVLEFAYTTAANGPQRRSLLAEFYGPQYALFHSGRPLDELFEEKPELKPIIMRDLGVVVRAVLEKGLLAHSIVHRILLDYITFLSPSEVKDMAQTLRDHVVHILHTKEGAQIGAWCVTYGSPKDRKAVIKSFKSFVVKIALEEYGHLVLLRLIDVTDDTVLVRKALYSELMRDKEELLQVLSNRTGRLVFLHLLTPCSPRYYSQDTIKQLQPAFFPSNDPAAAPVPTSKKEPDARRKELLDGLMPEIMSVLLPGEQSSDEVSLLQSLIMSQYGNFVVLELALHASDANKEKLRSALVHEATRPGNAQLLDDFVASRFYKRLLKLAPGFGLLLAKALGDALVQYAQEKEASHVVVALLNDEGASAHVRSILAPHKAELPTRFQPLLSA